MPRKSWWARLPFGVRMTAGACAMFVIVGGGVAGAVSTMTAPGTSEITAQPIDADLGAPRLEEDPEVVSRAAAAAEPLPRRHGEAPAEVKAADDSTTAPAVAGRKAPAPHIAAAAEQLSRARIADDRADRTGQRPARTLAEAPALRRAAAAPVIATRTEVETRAVPFDTEVIRDPSMLRGTRRVETRGAAGEQTLRYLVTLTDGKQTARRLLSSTVTRKPQNRVIAVGSARQVEPDVDCDQILGICLPFGRTAMACPADDPAEPLPDLIGSGGQILITDEDLELLHEAGIEAGIEAGNGAGIEAGIENVEDGIEEVRALLDLAELC
ncbi:G5 domain-containing protein [Actinoplanes sp. NPDC026670]|uniref:G5 domain-containing protein n=1 Tax=Actinoplanes sp. NPDC026670 TaxID=3154700 RepID=UPI0034016ABA